MIRIKEIKIKEINDWNKIAEESNTATFFQTKEWLEVWMKHFFNEGDEGGGGYGVYEGEELVGITPLIKKDNTLELLGISGVLDGQFVSDFGDAIIIKGKENEVWEAVLKGVRGQGSGVSDIELNFIRENSPSFGILKDLGGEAEEVDVAPYIELPKSWDEYLLSLDRHDRHELKRKLRRLEEEEAFHICPEGKTEDVDEFLRLMKLSSDKKTEFLSKEMESFFRDIFLVFSKTNQLKLCFLKLNNINIASVIIFTYKNEYLLYNSGYDPEYQRYSPGLLLKAFTIKKAIEEGKKRYDFLRGNERYKYDLGGRPRRLYKITFGQI